MPSMPPVPVTEGKRHFFERFPYVRPEPVLVKQCILYINGSKSAVFSPSFVSP